jgi:hypothetical protein
MAAYFWIPLRIFPLKLHSPRAHNGKRAVVTVFFASSFKGTGFAPTRRRGEIESLFSLFSSTDTNLSQEQSMKKITNSLMPFAVLVLFGTCLVSVFGLLVVLMTSVGLADGVPLSYYQRLNIPVISIALPIVGMILFTAILLGLPRKSAEAVRLTVIEGAESLPVSEGEKKEEHLAKAA